MDGSDMAMKFDYSRSKRVSELILEEVSWIIKNEVKDPGVGFVTLTGVDVSEDLRHARVHVSIMGSEREKRRNLQALNRAKGYIRSSFGKKVRLKYIPEFRFLLDRSLERVKRIDDILRNISDEPSGEGVEEG
jgi:ribosome-binding factor A